MELHSDKNHPQIGARMVKLISPFSAPSTKEEAFTQLSAALESDAEDAELSIYAFAKKLGAIAHRPGHKTNSDLLESLLETVQGGNAIRQLRTKVLSEVLRSHVPETSWAQVVPLHRNLEIYS